MDKTKAVQVQIPLDWKLEKAVQELIKSREKGENIYYTFNGHKLYSADVNVDSAYKEVTGFTKKEVDEGRKKLFEQFAKEKEDAIDSIPKWVERGKVCIPKPMHETWVDYVFKSAKGPFSGEGIVDSLDLMEMLKNGAPFEEVKKAFDEKVKNGAESYILLEIVGKFAEKGRQFEKFVLNIPEIRVNGTLEDTVKELIKARRQGKKFFADFDGHFLYSEDVTMDSAFKEVYGLTKFEFDKKRKEAEREDLKRQYGNLKKNVESLPDLVEKGRQFVYPERFEEWEQAVYTNIMMGYGAFVVEDALAIMEVLEHDESMEKAFELLKKRDQNHSGGSMGALTKLIVDFAKKGPEFLEMINFGHISPEEQARLDQKKAENAELAAKNAGKKL